MNLIKWFKRKKKKSLDLVLVPEPVLNAELLLVPNSLWVIRQNWKDPFDRKNYPPVRIIEVRRGWVNYDMGSLFPDERMEAEKFVKIYEPLF